MAGKDRSRADWLCKTCTGRDGGAFRNYGARTTCKLCGLAKGSCFGQKVAPTQPSRAAAPTFAEKQLVQQQAAELKKREAELRRREAEVQKLEKRMGEATAAAAEEQAGGGGMDDDTEGELGVAVSRARERLKKAKDMPEEVRDLVAGGYEACLARLQGELVAAQAARRAANPLKRQLESAEAHQARMAKKSAEAQATLRARQAERAELDRQLALQQQAVTAAEAAAAQATAEVAALAAQYAAERSGPATAAAAVPAEAPPGFVSAAYADQVWAEREAAFAQQLAQLQALGTTQGEGGAAAAEAPASVASDLGSIEDLEDDDSWKRVAAGKRRALLRRERDALAFKVRTTLGKVSSASSALLKKAGQAGK